MKFSAITASPQLYSDEKLTEAYKSARTIGVLRMAEEGLFFRAHFHTWFIPYTEIRRCFRRVQLVPAKLCCGKGDFAVENLVIEGEEGELAQIQLPGTRAAKAAMEELKARVPQASFSAPEKKEAHPE